MGPIGGNGMTMRDLADATGDCPHRYWAVLRDGEKICTACRLHIPRTKGAGKPPTPTPQTNATPTPTRRGRETVTVKAARYLAEGRLTLEAVTRHEIRAHCRGDGSHAEIAG